MATKARIIASLLSKAKDAPPNSVKLGDSDDTRLFVPGVGLDTNLAQTGQSLVWNDTTNQLGFGNPLPGVVSIYDSINQLPLTGDISLGQKAFVNDTNKLYLYEGSGWYNIAIINQSPTFTTSPSLSYVLSTDGTPTVVTLAAEDSEGVPLTWSYETSGLLNEATITQGSGDSSNVFTITPSTSDSDEGNFTITFKVSDGINISSESSSFTLAFFKQLIVSWPENQYDTFSNVTDSVYDESTQTHYTLGYAENWSNTGNNTSPVLMTKHDANGVWQAGYRYHNTSSNYDDGASSTSVLINGSDYSDPDHLYAACALRTVQVSSSRTAHFYLKIRKSDLRCIDASEFYQNDPNGPSGGFHDKDLNSGTFLLNDNGNVNRSTVCRVGATSLNAGWSKYYTVSYYTGANSPFNIHGNDLIRVGILQNQKAVIYGEGWDLLDTNNYYRRGGPLIVVVNNIGSVTASKFIKPNDTSTRWNYMRVIQGHGSYAAVLNGVNYLLYERYFGTGSLSASIRKYHFIEFTDDLSTTWNYTRTIACSDNDFEARNIFSDGTYLYVTGFGNRKSWIVKINPSTWTAVETLRIRTSGSIQPLAVERIKFYGNNIVATCSMGYNGTSDTNGGFIGLSKDFSVYSTTETAQSGDYSQILIQRDTSTTWTFGTDSFSSSSGNLTVSSGSAGLTTNYNFITNNNYPNNYGSSASFFNVNSSTTSLDKDGVTLTI